MSAGKRDISCRELRESLAAYLDDELTPDERELIESHLSACRRCSEELDFAVGIHDRIIKASDTLSHRIAPSPDVWLSVKRRIAADGRTFDVARWPARAKFRLGKEIVMKALFSKQPMWKLAMISGFVIIGLIVGLTVGMLSGEDAYAQAERIASESQEVQAALGGEVAYANTISLQDNIGTLVCSGETGEMAAVIVDIGNKSVTDVSPIELTQGEEQQAVAIAMADSRIKELVDQGAVIGNVSPDYSLGNGVNAGARYVLPNVMIAARMSLELDYQLWYITVDLDEEKVQDFVWVPKTLISMAVISPEQVWQVIAIAKADTRVKELLDKGAVIVRAGSGVAFNDEGIPEYTGAVLTMGDRRWQVAINLIKGQVTSVSEDSFGNISSEEFESFFASGYALNPLDVRDILDIVESDQDVAALISTGAEIIGIRPVVDWQCHDIARDGLESQECSQKDGKVEQIDVMLGRGAIWWDAIIDLDMQEVVEIREYSYSGGQTAEAENVSTGGYAFAPLQVSEILEIVESDQDAMALISGGAEIIGIRPVLEWECTGLGNESGVQRQTCQQKGIETSLADVMYGQRLTWWDVIVDIDLQEVVEVREYTYDAGGSHTGNGSTSTDAGQSVVWETNFVKLAADDFYINASGVKYIANVQSVEITSDPGDSEYCTLELIWHEHGNEMRLNMYFRSDGTYWWSDEIRTYNGQQYPEADWIIYTGEFFKTELGSPFVGNIDFISDPDNNYSGTIHFGGLELQAFLDAD